MVVHEPAHIDIANLQVLIATIEQHDHSLPDKMQLNSPAIIGNQTDFASTETFSYRGHSMTYINTTERGVGKNRNIVLSAATANICLFGDDDMRYENGYVQTVLEAFKCFSDADVIVFNLREPNSTRFVIPKPMRVHWWNVLRYGAARTAIRRTAIERAGIRFNEHFGGGTEHAHGEDSIFFMQCLQRGLKIYAVPAYIATLTDERASTWQGEYNATYIRDQGALYRAMSPNHWKFFALQDSLRRARSLYATSPLKAYKLMKEGARVYAAALTSYE